ncbi:15422_t:CDS:2, partial [Gigaspora margarita]
LRIKEFLYFVKNHLRGIIAVAIIPALAAKYELYTFATVIIISMTIIAAISVASHFHLEDALEITFLLNMMMFGKFRRLGQCKVAIKSIENSPYNITDESKTSEIFREPIALIVSAVSCRNDLANSDVLKCYGLRWYLAGINSNQFKDTNNKNKNIIKTINPPKHNPYNSKFISTMHIRDDIPVYP